MFYHVDVGDDDLVVLLELLELFWVIASASTLAHDDSVFALAINQIKHVCAHALYL